MDTFVKGELAIMQHASYFAEWDGAPAVVVGGLAPRISLNMHTLRREVAVGYQVVPLVEGGFQVHCRPHQLRKLQEPDADEQRRAGQRHRTPKPVIVP